MTLSTNRFLLLVTVLLAGGSIFAESARSPARDVESIWGDVLIQSAGSGRVQVLVDTFKGGRDGFVDQWFTLEAEDAALDPVSIHLPVAEILHYEGGMRITSADHGTSYDLVVADFERTLPNHQHFPVQRFVGFGLSHNIGDTGLRIPKFKRNASDAYDCESCLVQDPSPGGGSGGAACGSGGPGSTSCSVSNSTNSCSVSCASGYYACCNVIVDFTSCRCVRG